VQPHEPQTLHQTLADPHERASHHALWLAQLTASDGGRRGLDAAPTRHEQVADRPLPPHRLRASHLDQRIPPPPSTTESLR
jgi:hypothetical protein